MPRKKQSPLERVRAAFDALSDEDRWQFCFDLLHDPTTHAGQMHLTGVAHYFDRVERLEDELRQIKRHPDDALLASIRRDFQAGLTWMQLGEKYGDKDAKEDPDGKKAADAVRSIYRRGMKRLEQELRDMVGRVYQF